MIIVCVYVMVWESIEGKWVCVCVYVYVKAS